MVLYKALTYRQSVLLKSLSHILSLVDIMVFNAVIIIFLMLVHLWVWGTSTNIIRWILCALDTQHKILQIITHLFVFVSTYFTILLKLN